ncbi:MAG: glycosyltransferase family 2 protein [Deltaproteobacteria bacterium HGW-Deltaproteobacteria-21]|nr:MAG: glycosyltransferase family 2 protein [Deltaproteobacteria bacterium HGW-Deltaproteobacteria-21]
MRATPQMGIFQKPASRGRFAVVIPTYNHGGRVAQVAEESLKLTFPVFVVDDGSTDSTQAVLSSIKGVRLLRHSRNRGKGAALMTGFAEASKVADWVITIDADGQHNPKDALKMIQGIPENDRPIIVGMRRGMDGKSVPWTSRFGRKFSNFWVWLSGGPAVEDSQSGFRIYPVPEVMSLNVLSRRFQFEVEILVKARWKRIRVIEVPVGVNYAEGAERISHFRPMVDFLRNSSTFARLIFQRIVRRPAS